MKDKEEGSLKIMQSAFTIMEIKNDAFPEHGFLELFLLV